MKRGLHESQEFNRTVSYALDKIPFIICLLFQRQNYSVRERERESFVSARAKVKPKLGL